MFYSVFLSFFFNRLIDWFVSLLKIKTYLTREQWVIWNGWIVLNISGQLKWICFSSANRSKCKYSVAHAHQHNNLLVFVLLNKISRNTNVLCQFKSRERDFFCKKNHAWLMQFEKFTFVFSSDKILQLNAIWMWRNISIPSQIKIDYFILRHF